MHVGYVVDKGYKYICADNVFSHRVVLRRAVGVVVYLFTMTRRLV